MQYSIYPHLPDNIRGCIATTGFFDGVHRGHQMVLKQVVETAKIKQKLSCVITFWPHPRIVLHKDADKLKLLTTLEEKRELIAKIGIDNLVVIPFTSELSQLSAKDFFENFLIRDFGISHLIIGYDHHFGKGGQSNFAQLAQIGQQAGIMVEQLQAASINGITISSSKIRDSIQNNDIRLANNLLAYNYQLSGQVVHGKKLGRELGFPTANIIPDNPLKLIPSDGIYAVQLTIQGDNVIYKGMLSIGVRPTIDDENLRTIEVNIFDFDDSIYGKSLTIQFLARLRDELKFDSLETLRQQLIKDKADTLLVFDKLNK